VEALARLSTSRESVGRTYHLTNPEPPTVFEVEELFAKALGKSFLYMPVPVAVAKAFFTPGPLQRYFGMPVQSIDYFDHPCRYDSSQTVRDLAASGLTCPRFQDYAQRLVAFYKEKREQIRRGAMI